MTRPYHSPLRAHSAHDTRLRVIRAAADLFCANGYAGTSVRRIASSADVSIDRIYALGGKVDVFLAALELVLSGMPDGTPLLQAPGMQEVWDAPTLPQVVDGLAAATTQANARGLDMWPAFVEGARSEPGLAQALADKDDAMREQGHRAIRHLVARGLCAAPLDTQRTVDLMWAHAHPTRYALLVGHAGWRPEQFQADLTAAILRLLS